MTEEKIMTGFEIIQLLWEAGKAAYEIATGLKKQKEEDRKKVAELFEHIGNLLHSTYVELENGQYPYGHCRQIEIFAEKMKKDLKNILGDNADRLGNLLLAAHKVEGLAREISSGNIDKKELIKIEESSGEFLAASKLMCISLDLI
jgi:hypothetical protein